MLLLPCSLGRARSWIVKRAASTCYRPVVRPFDLNEARCEIPTVSKTSHKPLNALLISSIITDLGNPDDP